MAKNTMAIDFLGESFDLGFLGQLLVAYLLALPIAFDRERAMRSAGLRTFPIVSVASCAFLLVAQGAFDAAPEPMARVLYGLMTGIGFIGGGAIVKEQGIAHGTATAASIWSTAAIGASVAFHRYDIAVAMVILVWLTLLVFAPVKGVVRPSSRHDDRPG
jgi:putative Mg2+ transporter-C (MgtC) family protein